MKNALAVLLLAAPAAAQAQATEILLSHHGRLVDGDDNPREGTFSLTFRLYELGQKPVNSDDQPVWFESYTVTVKDGLYAVLLGTAEGGRKKLTAAEFPNGVDRYLTVQVGEDAEMTPRLRVGTVPYALGAAQAADAAKIEGQDLDALDARYAPAGSYAALAASDNAAAQTGHVVVSGTVKAGELRATGHAQAGTLDVTGAITGASLDVSGSIEGGALSVAGITATSANVSGNVKAASFEGDGALLTNLNAGQLSSGLVPSARISGEYSSVLNFSNTGNTFKGTFDGTFSGSFAGALQIPATAAAPSCGAQEQGKLYFNTTESRLYVCAGASGWTTPLSRPVELQWTPPTLDMTLFGATRGIATLRNAGDSAAAGLAINTAGTFVVAHDCGTSLAARAACTAVFTLQGGTPGATVTGSASATAAGAAAAVLTLRGTVVPRTCRDIKLANSSALDGPYFIDPDGGGGNPPIEVYCDMTTDNGGWTLAAYCPKNTGNPTQNFWDLRCGGGSYHPTARNACASLPSVDIARTSNEMLLARSNSDNQTGNINSYTTAYKFTIPDPANVNFVNHSRYGPFQGTDTASRGPCVSVSVTTLKGSFSGGTRYTFKYALGVSWSDSYPTGYGVNPNSDCMGTWSLGPFFTSVHSGSGHPSSPGSFTNACVTNGNSTYQHQQWYDGDGANRSGSASIWFK